MDSYSKGTVVNFKHILNLLDITHFVNDEWKLFAASTLWWAFLAVYNIVNDTKGLRISHSAEKCKCSKISPPVGRIKEIFAQKDHSNLK